MSFHPEVMPPVQQEVLRRLGAALASTDFYLAGGTAVAIHLGHRTSIDLDWFTPRGIPDPMRLAADLKDQGIDLAIHSIAEGTLHAESQGVRLSFLAYQYPLLQPTLEWPEYGCRLASLDDLACMKLSAVASRGARKDFIDLHALGRSGFGLAQMLDLYQEKFQTRDIGHVVYSLTYFDDAEEEETPEMFWDLAWGDVKRTIEGRVRELSDRRAPPETTR
jgi:hypothetical protein